MRVQNGNQAIIDDLNIDVLFDEVLVQSLVKRLAREVSEYYGDTPFTMIGILNACAPFMFDLLASLPDSLRQIVRYDFVQATSRKGTQSLGTVEITGPSKVSIKDQCVLIVEGIVGSGLTLSAVIPHLRHDNPLDIKVCALFENPTERAYDVPVDFCGIVVPPKFIIGYGLDFNNDYRGLPYIGVLN